MKEVYLLYIQNDDIEPFLAGVATTKDKAKQMCDRLCQFSEDVYECVVEPIEINTLILNDEKELF